MEKQTLWEGVFWSGSGMVQNDDVIVLGGFGEDMVELAGIWTLNNFQFMTVFPPYGPNLEVHALVRVRI